MTTAIFRSPYMGCCSLVVESLRARFPDYTFLINPLQVKEVYSVEMEAPQERYDELMPDVFFYVGFAFHSWLIKQPNHSQIKFYNDGFR